MTRAQRGEGYVELALVPHPLFADPADVWLPPGARGLVVRLDPGTGFLSAATVHDDRGPLATVRVHELNVHDVRSSDEAGWVVTRMARTLVEPVRLTADGRRRRRGRPARGSGLRAGPRGLTVDPETGVLVQAEATAEVTGDEEADGRGRVVFRQGGPTAGGG
ncbi:hypothetical protein ACIPM2_19005 [Streptomyces sp. NPDC086081]|uniref:hypothetical protein n=1 Tax=Streptomyces sp. NPDC086081 TaxID=3365749 RepID=UPI0037F8E3C0